MLKQTMTAVLAALAVLLSPAAAEARWLRAETAHFVIYSDGPEWDLRRYAVDLEAFEGLLRSAHGLDPAAPVARKLDIYLVVSERDLRRVFPDASGAVGGVYQANLGDIYAVAVRGYAGEDRGMRILFHEYTHHFMLQNFTAAYPAWLVEGYAEYFGATRIKPDKIEVGVAPAGRAANLTTFAWLPLETVTGLGPPDLGSEKGRTAGAMFYAQSWLLTHYMLSDPQRKLRLNDYLRAIGEGEHPGAAFQAALGMSFAEAEKALKAYLRSTPAVRYPRDETESRAAPVAITVMPASADDLILEGQRLKNDVPAADRPAVLATIRARAARHRGDRLADLVLARAEITFGDRTAGEAILARRIAADARDADALWLMAFSRILAGQADPARRAAFYAEARPWLGKAFAVDPNSYQVLYDYAQTRSLDADFPTDNTLAVLLKAHAIAPQVAPVTLAAGRALMKRRRFAEAIVLLSPLANRPHGGGAALAARRLIERAKAGQSAPPSADDAEETDAAA